MRFAFIRAEKASWPVRAMCRVLRVSPSGFYAWLLRPESAHQGRDRALGVLVREAHERSRSTYGSPRVHAQLKANGVTIGRKRVMRLMSEQDLQGRRRRSFVRTTDSRHDHPVAPNVLNRDFTANKPNEKWVGDVTFLHTPDGWLYLAVVLDLFSRFVVGWAISPVNDRELALRALDMAVRRRRPGKGLLHHTDRGSPYASQDYQAALTALGIECSMSRTGNCYDNAVMESWFGKFKTELGEDFESPEHAQRDVFDHIEVFYNQQRIHSTLGYLSPAAFERRPPVASPRLPTAIHNNPQAASLPPNPPRKSTAIEADQPEHSP